MFVHDYANLVSGEKEIYRHPPPPLNSHVQYSFLVQCRKFGIFFATKESNHPEDIVASHFLGHKIAVDLSEWTAWGDHMNTHLFHLSYLRVDNTRPWTGYEDLNKRMLAQFRAAWRKFLAELPEPYKDEFVNQIFLRKQPHADGQLSEFRDLDLD